jgi:hypothetical protein
MSLKAFFCKRIILYPLIGVVGFYLTKYFFPTKEDSEKPTKLKELEKDFKKDLGIKDLPDLRGGFLIKDSLSKIVETDNVKYVLGGVLAICSLAVTDRFQAVLKRLLEDASPVFVALPMPIARRLLEGFGGLDSHEILKVLKEGLVSNQLTVSEKLILIKKSVYALILSANTPIMKRNFLITALLLIAGIKLTEGGLLVGAIGVFQGIFTRQGLKRGITEFIVSIYREYNTPFPEDLTKLIEEVGIKI